MPRRLASSTSACAEARTWVTVPGVLSTVSSHMVWIESITATLGASGCSRVATMSRTEVAALRWTGALPRPSRSARNRTWSIASSPEM